MAKMSRQKNGSKNFMKKYFIIVASIVGVFILISSIGLYAFSKFSKPASKPVDYTKIDSNNDKNNESSDKSGLLDNLLPPAKTNVLLLGTDKSKHLSDVIIVGSFDRDTASINLINVPRDTYCSVLPEIKTEVKEKAGKSIPSEVKMTDLHSWAGREMGPWAVKTQIESYMGIAIDYTVRIDLEAFKKIVDLLGPVTMEIPEGGLSYWDPEQDLTINVPGGVQELDGEMAEGVVRYRATYRMGDLQRIEVQQEFMKCFFEQALKKENLISNAPGLFSAVYEYVETDFKLSDMYKYITYIPKLSPSKFDMTTLPGEPRDVYYNNNEDKISYYFYDPVETAKLVDEVFYSKPSEIKSKIQIFNAGMDKEKTDAIIKNLTEAGFIVTLSETYEEEKPEESIIITDDEDLGEKLKEYVKDVKIESGKEIDEEYDAVIVFAEG
ncbi:LCP family protein [Anaeropeptidivorans aminofermentans]|uniref:LCP family protein n=1 Tax=Anaeropeptidivorans aminofermentans TaxID=2934315 RepID=UPI002024A36F|nr:LCP family protein [Anaeropeptidivorans aminofermentans]